jgi:o-succinylbenzoate---CoA ligase
VDPLSVAHHFQQRLHEQWLFGLDRWVPRTQARLKELLPLTQADTRPRILLSLKDPVEFLAAFMAGCMTESAVFLGNPHWSCADWQRAIARCEPQVIWSDGEQPFTPFPASSPASAAQKGWIMIPTGGSSGQIRFAIHTWSTLMASVQSCQQYFEISSIHSCCTLPLYHVSGLMQFLRSFTTGGNLLILPFKDLLEGNSSNPGLADFLDVRSQQPRDFFLSLVPTQLQRLLQNPERISWLARFHTILLGGAPAWPALLDAAQHHQLHLAPTYGMTETASQVATLKPHNFLRGNRSSGQVLPYANITIQDDQERPLPANKTGTIVVQTPSLCLGYYPKLFTKPGTFVTDDLGYLSRQSERGPDLYIVGRHSRKIISGGENIFPEEIEAAIRATGLVTDVYVTGLPNVDWGEVAIALYIPLTSGISQTEIQTALQETLSKLKYPKQWIELNQLPRNAQGKVNRGLIEKVIQSHLKAQNR